LINHRLTSSPPLVPQAHDESNMCGPGDKVLMVHSRPLSKHKKWVVTEILRKERVYDHGNVGKKKESLLFDGDAAAGDSSTGATSDDVTGLGAAPQVIGVPSKPTQASLGGSRRRCLASKS
jgi:hypothetical protein